MTGIAPVAIWIAAFDRWSVARLCSSAKEKANQEPANERALISLLIR